MSSAYEDDLLEALNGIRYQLKHLGAEDASIPGGRGVLEALLGDMTDALNGIKDALTEIRAAIDNSGPGRQ